MDQYQPQTNSDFLQIKLEEMLGSSNVYYQAPASVNMKYPAIRFKKKKPSVLKADNALYVKTYCYEIIVISRVPDHPVLELLEAMPMCTWDTGYESDGLHHDVFTLYY